MLNKIQHQFKRKADILLREGSNLVVKSPLMIQSKHGSASTIDIVKTAGADISASKFHGQISRDGSGNVDLVAEMAKHPEALWIRVKAIEADIPNDNGDYFSREEIIKAYKSFEGVPVFTNHENGKVENAKGKVVKAEWDDQEGAVYCTMFVDREANAPLCRAIEEGYVTDVSMGTQVDYSTCSVCEKKALDASSYCDHIKTMKGRMVDGKKAFEKNYGLKFIEISVVTDGACKDCTIREIMDPTEYLHKVATAVMTVNKAIKTSQMVKDGGQAEIQKLNQAMDLLEDVTQTMLGQRQFIDLEFASKVMEVLADLQHVNDELVDQGYGRIGDTGAQQQQQQMGVPPLPENSTIPKQEQVMEGQKPPLAGPSNIGVGTVTEPAMASSSGGKTILSSQSKLKDLHEKITKIYDEAKSRSGGVSVDKEKLAATAAKLAKIWENPSIKKFQTEVSEGDLTVVIGNEDIWGVRGGQKIASLKIANLDADIKDKLASDPKGFAEEALEAFKDKYAGATAKMAKAAGYAPTDTKEQHEQTMEAQLRTQKLPLHPRDNDARQSITESQLGDKREGYDYNARQNNPRDGITEAQLEKGDYHGYEWHKIQDAARDEITEKQLGDEKWKGNTNPSGKDGEKADGVSDQAQQITEGQLNDWKKADKRHCPTDSITEKQLATDSENWGRRIASRDDAFKAKTAAFKALAKTAIATGATPDEMISIVSDFSASPKNSIAAERAVESLKGLKETREAMLRRAKFHGVSKIATSNEIADYMLGAMADEGMSGEVARETMEAIYEQKMATKQIEEAISAAKTEEKPAKTASSKDFLREAFADESEEIGVLIPKSTIKVDEKDEEKFAEAAYELATKEAAKLGYKITAKIHVANKGDNLEVAMRGVKAPVEEKASAKTAATEKTEKPADLEARKEARKQVVAQFGGGMPGDMAGGAMPGAGGGTTMPAGPAAADPMAGVPPVAGIGTPTDDAAAAEEDTGGEALPPGSTCPACGSDDVEVRHGDIFCNNCGMSGHIEVTMHVNNWPNTMEDTQPKKKEEEGGIGEMGGGAGMELPAVGIQASFNLTPEMVKKAGSKPIGSFCPHCGSNQVKTALKQGCGECECGLCGGKYEVETLVDTQNNVLTAKVRWMDNNVTKLASKKMEEAKMAKKASAELAGKKAALDEALRKSGNLAKFAKADLKGKAEIIAGLADQGMLQK